MSVKAKYAAALADYVLEYGLAAASLRPMAKAAGTSDRMLVYHFGSKAGVMEAALTEIATRNKAAMDAMLPPEPLPATTLMPLLGAGMASGVFDRDIAVLLEVSALSIRGDLASARIAHAIASDFRDWLAARLTEPERATRLLSEIEGWGVLRACGLDLPFPTG